MHIHWKRSEKRKDLPVGRRFVRFDDRLLIFYLSSVFGFSNVLLQFSFVLCVSILDVRSYHIVGVLRFRLIFNFLLVPFLKYH